MAKALFVVALGTADGVNRDFTVGAPYVPGSTIVFLNGAALRKDYENGWAELGGDRIRMNEAPFAGDVVQVYLRPQTG